MLRFALLCRLPHYWCHYLSLPYACFNTHRRKRIREQYNEKKIMYPFQGKGYILEYSVSGSCVKSVTSIQVIHLVCIPITYWMSHYSFWNAQAAQCSTWNRVKLLCIWSECLNHQFDLSQSLKNVYKAPVLKGLNFFFLLKRCSCKKLIHWQSFKLLQTYSCKSWFCCKYLSRGIWYFQLPWLNACSILMYLNSESPLKWHRLNIARP